MIRSMPLKTLRAWLGVDRVDQPEHMPLRGLLEALDQLDPERAKYLARFAYLLGRVAHADRHVSPEETRAMETILMKEGDLSLEQAMLVVGLAKTSNLLFGGTADYLVAQEFAAHSSYEDKLALLGCLFAVSVTDESISMAEETEIHRIANHLKVDPPDITRLRLVHRKHLPGLANGRA
jgi:uncharacterized tellurite resistance protein B-like protein